jgi:miniconductance mechanosensitive channel
MLNQFKKFDILRDYLEEKEEELRAYNSKNNSNSEMPINGRSQTNIGVFRAYLQHYLEKHPKIRKDLTLMVKQNAPSEKGVPIQIYVFSNIIDWVEYEAIQSDIFDHVFAIIPYFQLEMFQNPSGNDFQKLVN